MTKAELISALYDMMLNDAHREDIETVSKMIDLAETLSTIEQEVITMIENINELKEEIAKAGERWGMGLYSDEDYIKFIRDTLDTYESWN